LLVYIHIKRLTFQTVRTLQSLIQKHDRHIHCCPYSMQVKNSHSLIPHLRIVSFEQNLLILVEVSGLRLVPVLKKVKLFVTLYYT
jgi:hypothetical protein